MHTNRAQADYKEILDRHNNYRARHQAGPLSWSDSLARGAQDWANSCNWKHSQTSDGENMSRRCVLQLQRAGACLCAPVMSCGARLHKLAVF
jgi:uncharacterized protein YkwD